MPVPRYRYLPLKGQYRLVADASHGPGHEGAARGELHTVTTVSDAEVATQLAVHLAVAAADAFRALVPISPPGPLPVWARLPAALPVPVIRAVTAEVARVAAQLADELTEPGSVVWLARQAWARSIYLSAHPDPLGKPGELMLRCSCSCFIQLRYRSPTPDDLPPGWQAWAFGAGRVELFWLENVDVCEGCECHRLGTLLAGTNPLVDLLVEVGRQWLEADRRFRRASVMDTGRPLNGAVRGLTEADVVGQGLADLIDIWSPTLLLTDLKRDEQLALGGHVDAPGRFFAATRSAGLERRPDLLEVDGYLARTAGLHAEDAGWGTPWPVDLPPAADPDDPATWPAADQLLRAALRQHRALRLVER